MAIKIFEDVSPDQVTDEMLQEAATLFSENYGVWSHHSAQTLAKPGSRVRLTRQRLRNEHLLDGASSYVRVSVNGKLVGHAFANRWTVQGKSICWVTQLVVHREYRRRGLALGLLQAVKRDEDNAYGILSSHPAACLAAIKAFGKSINPISHDYIRDNAESIVRASPVRYIQEARLRGKLFDPDTNDGLVSCADTRFYVDHKEPLEALNQLQRYMDWPLGSLLDGHEFLVLIQANSYSR